MVFCEVVVAVSSYWGGIALAFQVVLVLGCCPFPMFLGEVLSDFHFSMLPSTSCNVLHCLLGFALLE